MRHFLYLLTLFFTMIFCFPTQAWAQNKESSDEIFVNDTLPLAVANFDSIAKEQSEVPPIKIREYDPIKAVWLAALFPGAGQIYNQKLWKLPIVYGGFLGCTYGYSWNQRYYKGYATAYRDLIEDNPNKSYLNYVPPTFDVENSSNRQWLEGALKRKKDFYRRNRDLSIIGMLGVYLISIIDAYVDASLYNFDISPDVSMHLEPAVILPQQGLTPTSVHDTSLGLQWSIKF